VQAGGAEVPPSPGPAPSRSGAARRSNGKQDRPDIIEATLTGNGAPGKMLQPGGVAMQRSLGPDETPGPGCQPTSARAFFRVLERSMAMVIGPTPPGTGVMAEAR